MNNICITGAGRIAHSLAAALAGKGYNITSVYSRRLSEAGELASAFNIKYFTDNISEIPADTDLFFLAVPDGAIRTAAGALSEGNFSFDRSLFVHLSGSLNIKELEILSKKGASAASFHIMQTFPAKTIVPLNNCYVAVESSDEKTEQCLFNTALRLSMIPFRVASEKKAMYHMIGVFASNFLVASLYNALLAFESSGIEGADFSGLVDSIAKSTIENVMRTGVFNSLSGPVKRGDYRTIVNHIELLTEECLRTSADSAVTPALFLNYISSSLSLLDLIEKKEGPLNEGQEQIRKYLVTTMKNLPAV